MLFGVKTTQRIKQQKGTLFSLKRTEKMQEDWMRDIRQCLTIVKCYHDQNLEIPGLINNRKLQNMIMKILN